MKSGFIAILGRPNAGKSTLINTIIGEKVSIVSPKPQTTREQIRGILTTCEYQLIFLDTPGAVLPRNKLQEMMVRDIKESERDVDVLLYVVDGEHGITRQDMELINGYAKRGIPLVVAFNKIDLVGDYKLMLPELDKLNSIEGVSDVVPLSASQNKNVDELKKTILKYIKEGPMYYEGEQYTDRSERFIYGEIVREKALYYLNNEVPHGVGVAVAALEDGEKLLRINVDMYVEKASHKGIVIGKNGEKLKRIGTAARKSIEQHCGKKVMLEIFVKVREDWRNDPAILNDIGYRLR